MFDSDELAIESLSKVIEITIPEWPDHVAMRNGALYVVYSRYGDLCFCAESTINSGQAYHDLTFRIAWYRYSGVRL